jgi:hypothetical protein
MTVMIAGLNFRYSKSAILLARRHARFNCTAKHRNSDAIISGLNSFISLAKHPDVPYHSSLPERTNFSALARGFASDSRHHSGKIFWIESWLRC